MDKKPFDFKVHRKTTLITLTGLGWHFYDLPYQVNPLWAVVPFYVYNITYLRVIFNNIIV